MKTFKKALAFLTFFFIGSIFPAGCMGIYAISCGEILRSVVFLTFAVISGLLVAFRGLEYCEL